MFLSSREEVNKIESIRVTKYVVEKNLQNEIDRINESWKPFASLVYLFVDNNVTSGGEIKINDNNYKEIVYHSKQLDLYVVKDIWNEYSIWKEITTQRFLTKNVDYEFVCFYKYRNSHSGRGHVVDNLDFKEKYMSLIESLFTEMKSEITIRLDNEIHNIDTIVETKKLIYPNFKENK